MAAWLISSLFIPLNTLRCYRLFDWLGWSALVGGALLTLSFAPFQQFWLAPLCVAWLAWLWSRASTPWHAALLGGLFGFGFFATSVSWIFISIYEYGGTPLPIALGLTLGLILLMASYFAIQGFFLTRYWPHNSAIKWLWVFPASWALMEWVRGWLFTGFPWMMLSYSQVFGPLNGYAAILGGYALSALVAWLGGALTYLYCQRQTLASQTKWLLISVLILIPLGGVFLQSASWSQPHGMSITASLVQGNIEQTVKWSPQYVYHSIDTYTQLSTDHWHSDLVIWPEASIPLPLDTALDFLQPVLQAAQANDTALLIGIPVAKAHTSYFYNALVGLGAAKGQYDKQHLVPFGEYIPFERWLGNVFDVLEIPSPSFTVGARQQTPITVHHIPIAAFICYEIAYASAVRQTLPTAQLLVTVSNDAWFGDSLAPYQHLQIAQFRSLQTQRDQLFATNDGVTASIDFRGRLLDRIPQFEAQVLETIVQPRVGSTPWVRTGDTPWLLLMLFGLLGGLCWERRHCG
ncbi:MAG: apolipoprotein N-acyltransferase [Legionellales bacterium]|nr:apolipoprotein N-acyltransferase [Legionellales bacterium]